MRKLTIAGRPITDEHPPYIIAEIGSNHMGDFNVCLEMVRKASEAGADAIKLQKRDNRRLFTKAAYNAPYNSEHAHAPTYGAHRDKLEFSREQLAECAALARELGMAFICTPFEEASADMLYQIGVDAFKIASSHLKDVPLIRKVAKYGIPVIISTGAGRLRDVQRAADHLEDCGANHAILHCTSLYPTTDDDLNLDVIPHLVKMFGCIVGFSSHHPGIEPAIIATMLGARIIEAHFTLNRGWPGTDHGFSLEPQGLRKLVEDTRRISNMRGSSFKLPLDKERKGFVFKQGRAVHPAKTIKAGEVLGIDNLCLKAPADGPEPYQLGEYIGRVAVCDISTADVLRPDMIQPINTEVRITLADKEED